MITETIRNIAVGVIVLAISSAGYAVIQVNRLDERIDSFKSLLLEVRSDVKEMKGTRLCN